MSPCLKKPLLCIVLLILPAIVRTQTETEPVEREVYAMGTSLRIVLFEPDREKGIRQMEALIHVVERAEAELSTWRAESELSRFNRQNIKQSFRPGPSLFSVLEKANEWCRMTGGAFDPAIGALGEIWGIHDTFRVPSEAEIRGALEKTGMKYLLWDQREKTITKLRPVSIDPGAFGKGEALDRALDLAEKEKFAPMLLDFGGQLAAFGGRTWEVSVADPLRRGLPSPVHVHFKTGSLSTSGGSERDGYAEGKKIGHILDPRTGNPVPSFGSVTVWHPRALIADILSTALYVMGPGKGFEWAARNRIAACFLVARGNELTIRKTPAFEAL